MYNKSAAETENPEQDAIWDEKQSYKLANETTKI